MTPLRILFLGSGAFGLPILAALKSQVVQVVSQVDRPSGRGRKLAPTPIAKFALDNNLPLIRTNDVNQETLPEADLSVVIAFGQKIAQEIANLPRLGSINLHASILPKFRGAAPVAWTILSGQTIGGNSVIRLAPRMDAGAILAQSKLEIGPVETSGELTERLSQDGVGLIQRVLDDLQNGRGIEQAQVEADACPAPKLSRDDAKIDWSQLPQTIACRIRGLWPWPGCHVALTDSAGGIIARLALVRARPAEGEGPRWKPGEIQIDGHVCCADGWSAVEILEVQPEGGRPMSVADYRRGHVWMPGMRINSE
jgi:methionyl-tRNA formyltransferase